jgi:hypothetical protein
VDEREQKSFILFLAKEWKASVREVLAYQLLVQRLKKSGVPKLNEFLEQCRQAPELESHLDAQFAELEKMLPMPAEASVDQALLELLAKHKPSGEPN